MGVLNYTEPHWFKWEKKADIPKALHSVLDGYSRRKWEVEIRDGDCYQGNCALQLSYLLNARYDPYHYNNYMTQGKWSSVRLRKTLRSYMMGEYRPLPTLSIQMVNFENKYSAYSKNNSCETTSPFILCPTSLNWPGRNWNNPVMRKVGSGVTGAQVCKPVLPQTRWVTLGKLVTLPEP